MMPEAHEIPARYRARLITFYVLPPRVWNLRKNLFSFR